MFRCLTDSAWAAVQIWQNMAKYFTIFPEFLRGVCGPCSCLFSLTLSVQPEFDPVAVEVALAHCRAECVPLEPVDRVRVGHVDEVRERPVEQVVQVRHGVDVLLGEADAPQVARGARRQRGQPGDGLVKPGVCGAPGMGFLAAFLISVFLPAAGSATQVRRPKQPKQTCLHMQFGPQIPNLRSGLTS